MSELKSIRNVCSVITTNGYCIGCGICAGICPAQVLKMQFNNLGEYQPIESTFGCLPKCNLCLSSCPFWNQEDNENTLSKIAFSNQIGINYSAVTGYYLDSYIGFSKYNGHRVNGSSGGLTTWLLETLLQKQIIDHVICVAHNSEPDKLYKFQVLNSVSEIRVCIKISLLSSRTVRSNSICSQQ